MKKLSVIFLFLMFFVLTNHSIAQYPCDLSNQIPCPTGLTGPYCITMQYYIPTLQEWVNVAVYYCLGTSGGITESIHHWDIADGSGKVINIGIDNLDFQGKVWEAIDNDVYNNHPTSFPPCNSGSSYIMVSHRSVNCIKVINDGPNMVSRIQPCNNSQFVCSDYYRVCYNTSTGKLVKTYDHSTVINSPDCPKFDPSVWQPPTGKTWGDYFETPCCYWDCPSH